MSESLVTTNTNNGVVHIQFNRGSKHNSLTLDMFDAIAAAGEQLHCNGDARVAVLSGEGPSFCAGLDMSVMKTFLSADKAEAQAAMRLLERGDGPDNLAQRVGYVWHTAPVPVIAAIRGVAFGGGFQIAMGCDIRVASPAARFCIMESRYGLIPDMSITQSIPRLMSRDQALELTLTAREFDGTEAHRLGLVTKLADDPVADALALAETIAARSPDAVRRIKRLYNDAWGVDATDSFKLEAELQQELIGRNNQVEAVRAAMEKREPRFSAAGS